MNMKHEPSEQPWGTLEELLLACAVNRHGTKSWDSIAIEVQNRCSGSPSLLTPQDCRDRFNDLKRRFMARNDEGFTGLVFLVDELRKIRIEELRREVERQDVLIVSLELKVKRLEEERRQSLKEEGEEVTDLKCNRDEKTSETKPSIGNSAGKSVSGEDSDDRENRSVNESNSTTPKDEAQQNPVERTGNKSGSARTAFEPEREWSFNGKAEVEDHDLVLKQEEEEEKSERKASPAGGLSDLNEALESLDESKREVKAGRLTSKRKKRNEVQKSCTSSGRGSGEPEGDEVSPATKRESDAKFVPLINFLDFVRSHQLGSAFECRLRSQVSHAFNG